MQIATELARHATVTLASRTPPRFLRQRPLCRDLHYWLDVTGFDRVPIGPFLRIPPTQRVLDTGRYRHALASGHVGRKSLFAGIDGTTVT